MDADWQMTGLLQTTPDDRRRYWLHEIFLKAVIHDFRDVVNGVVCFASFIKSLKANRRLHFRNPYRAILGSSGSPLAEERSE
jgi:hypothetical protein